MYQVMPHKRRESFCFPSSERPAKVKPVERRSSLSLESIVKFDRDLRRGSLIQR